MLSSLGQFDPFDPRGEQIEAQQQRDQQINKAAWASMGVGAVVACSVMGPVGLVVGPLVAGHVTVMIANLRKTKETT